MVTKEVFVWAVIALYFVLMVTQAFEYRLYPHSRFASALIMVLVTAVMAAFLAVVPYV